MSQVDQDEKRERLTRTVAAASLAASAVYVVWRWGWTLDTDHLWFSVPLALAETYGALAAALLTVTAWTLTQREAPAPVAGRTLDVFVTVAEEPIAVVRKTLLAAREIRYPHTTWLLDDGHRDELRTMADEIGVRYLRRDERLHGKAGNLNHALAHSSGELLLQLDADHVPLPHIADRLSGFFADDRMAVVQSQQDFYNTDAFTDDASGRRRELWGDQQLFFNVLQPGRDHLGAALFVGSCAMLRRAALEEIGGFGTESATVGPETSILLHARGWRSAYLNESLAFGLAPATAHAYQVQQLRRAQGALRILRRYPPLALRGLTRGQRLAYLESLTAPLGGAQRVVLYLAPIVFLATGVFPIRASIGTFALFFLPALVLRAVAFRRLTRGHGSLLLTDRYWMAKFFTHLLAVRAWVTSRPLTYRHRADEAGTVPLRTVAPQLTLIALTAGALAWATWARTLGFAADVPGWGLFALFGAVLLALWHAGLAGHIVQLSLAGRHRRAEHRFAESLSVSLRVLREDGKLASTDIAMTEDLTATGLALRCMYPIPEGARVELTLPLSSGEVQVRGHVVRLGTSETQLGTVHVAGVEFDGASREVRDAIELHCAQHAMPMERQRLRSGAMGAAALRRLRELRGERRVEVGMPARVFAGAGEGEAADLGVGLLEDVSPRGGRVVLDHPVSNGSRITLQIPGSTVRASGRDVFVHALETALGMRFVAGFETEGMPAPVAGAAPWYQSALRAVSGAVTSSRATAARVGSGSRQAAARLAAATRLATERVSTVARTAAARVTPPMDLPRTGQTAPAVQAAQAAQAAQAPQAAEPAIERAELPPAEPIVREAAAEAAPPAAPVGDPDRAIEMQIDGQFSFPFELSVGATVLITETGVAAADISAVHAIVLGRFTGTLRASKSVRVGPSAVLDGVIETPDLEVAPGAVINGVRAWSDAQPLPEPPDQKLASAANPQGSNDLTAAGSSSKEQGEPEPTATSGAGEPPAADAGPEGAPATEKDAEIFVASPIYTKGVSR